MIGPVLFMLRRIDTPRAIIRHIEESRWGQNRRSSGNFFLLIFGPCAVIDML